MGSTRLPGKVMMKINDLSVLECLFMQLGYCKRLDDVVLATTINPEDDTLIDFANNASIKIFRGSSLDVLDRYYKCAKQFSIGNIARITSDCPLVDPTIVDKAIELYETGRFDYVNNFQTNPYPSGTDTEIFSINALKKTWENAKKLEEREHVTQFIYNNPDQFSIGYIENETIVPDLHYSVDRVEDLQLVRALYEKISKRPILHLDIVKTIRADPKLLEINKNTHQKRGI